MAWIGLKNLYYAICTEDPVTGNETYGAPQRLASAVKLDLSVETASGKLFADNAVDVLINRFSQGNLKLEVGESGVYEANQIVGTTDGVKQSGDEIAPYVAIGFQVPYKKSGYADSKFVWLYKCKFKLPSESYETRKESVNFGTTTYEGVCIKRNLDGMWRIVADGDEEVIPVGMWFARVQ